MDNNNILYQSSVRLFSVCSRTGLSYLSYSYDRALTSPLYPGNYPPNSDCLWSLQRRSSSYAVRLTFHSFFLESKTSCSDDYVEIRDGDRLSSSKLIGKFCGSRLPPVIVSTYKYIFVRFVSDFDYHPVKRKFSASFRAIVPGKNEVILMAKLKWTKKISFSLPPEQQLMSYYSNVRRGNS